VVKKIIIISYQPAKSTGHAPSRGVPFRSALHHHLSVFLSEDKNINSRKEIISDKMENLMTKIT